MTEPLTEATEDVIQARKMLRLAAEQYAEALTDTKHPGKKPVAVTFLEQAAIRFSNSLHAYYVANAKQEK